MGQGRGHGLVGAVRQVAPIRQRRDEAGGQRDARDQSRFGRCRQWLPPNGNSSATWSAPDSR